MAIKKQFVKTKPVCKVTFLAKEANHASVVGILIIGIVLKEL
jgi:methyl coenzyme M reductase subunit C